jgi:hypothetical protein
MFSPVSLECRLCGCTYSQSAGSQPCPQLDDAHQKEIAPLLLKLPSKFNYSKIDIPIRGCSVSSTDSDSIINHIKINTTTETKPVLTVTRAPSRDDWCVLYCLTDLIQLQHLTPQEHRTPLPQEEMLSTASLWQNTHLVCPAAAAAKPVSNTNTADSETSLQTKFEGLGYTVHEACQAAIRYGCLTELEYQCRENESWRNVLQSKNCLSVTGTTGDNCDEDLKADQSKNIFKTLECDFYGFVNTIEGVKLALHYLGPCLLILPSYRTLGKFWLPLKRHQQQLHNNNNTPKEESPNSNSQSITPVLHALLIWGYRSNGFLLRNNGDKHWGLTGYGIISYADFLRYSVECWYFLSKSRLVATDSSGSSQSK